MITGYNTDVRHRGVVFHVQTEDKGQDNACVESLIYVGGQIVARRQSGYRTLLKEGKGKEAILELLERQHRAMIAEIRTGKMDKNVEVELEPLAPARSPAAAPGSAPTTVAGAPPVPADSTTASLDQVILDYLSSEAQQDHLVLIMDADEEPRLGGETTLFFLTKTSNAGEPVVEAAVSVRLISTASEPAVLGRGTTDGNGKLRLKVQIPLLPRGSAALIVTGKSDVGTAEIKHLL